MAYFKRAEFWHRTGQPGELVPWWGAARHIDPHHIGARESPSQAIAAPGLLLIPKDLVDLVAELRVLPGQRLLLSRTP